MDDRQQAIERVEDIDLDDEDVTALVMAVYGGAEVEDGGGYDDLVARREARVDRDQLEEAGWADPAGEVSDEELPLTEHGAAIYYFYHERAKGDGERERLLTEEPRAFARRAFEWWYDGENEGEAAGER